ncbi:MAG TPA: hypothetical protein VF266_15445 [Thermoanaerobaculia bacterium]
MGKTVEIPDELHEVLEERARRDGVTVSEFVATELQKQLRTTLTPAQLRERLRQVPPLDLGNLTTADLIREGREERTDQILDAITRR